MAYMNQTIPSQLGSLVLNDSQWAIFESRATYYSGVRLSENLQYSTWNTSSESSKYSYLRYNSDVTGPIDAVGIALDYYLRPNTFSCPVDCIYPISGQYGFLNRLLFYLLMIFALLARRRTWLAAAALGSAMTFAASAAIHALALLAYKKHSTVQDNGRPDGSFEVVFGDPDLQGIFPILVAGCIMLAPILHWSIEVREHARAIAVCWGLVMFTALVPTFVQINSDFMPFMDQSQLATCDLDASRDCFPPSKWFGFGAYSSDFYDRCNCNDTCGSVSPPKVPFRTGQTLGVSLLSDKYLNLVGKSSVRWISIVNSFCLLFIIIQGVLGLLEVNFTQTELRNKLFLFLGGTTARSKPTNLAARTRYQSAKVTALSFYLSAIALAIICPATFISSIVINEIRVWGYPVSEQPDAVGQWSTYVGAVFVLIAAVIQEYHVAWWRSLRTGFLGIVRPCLYISRCTREKSQSQQVLAEEELNLKKSFTAIPRFLQQCVRPFNHAYRSIEHSWTRVKEEWLDCKMWWNDPIFSSQQGHYRCLGPSSHKGSLSPVSYRPELSRSDTAPISSTSFLIATYNGSPAVSSSSFLPLNNQLGSPQPMTGRNSYSNDAVPGPIEHERSLT